MHVSTSKAGSGAKKCMQAGDKKKHKPWPNLFIYGFLHPR